MTAIDMRSWGSFCATAAGLIAALILQPVGMAWRPAWHGVRELLRPGSLGRLTEVSRALGQPVHALDLKDLATLLLSKN